MVVCAPFADPKLVPPILELTVLLNHWKVGVGEVDETVNVGIVKLEPKHVVCGVVIGFPIFTKDFTFIVNAVAGFALAQPVVEFLTEIFPVNVVFCVAPAGTAIVIGDDAKVPFVTAAKLFVGVLFQVMLY